MKELIPLDTRYVPLVQQKDCCVPACYSMIMLRHGIPLISQELIGHKLELVIPKENEKYFWNPPVGEPHLAGYGTNVGTTKENVNPDIAFKELGIPLKTTFTLIDSFKDLDDFKSYLAKLSSSDKDIILCYEWGSFSGDDIKKWGHVNILDIVNLKDETLRLIDPEYLSPKWVTVSIDRLYEAMLAHGPEKGGGFWEVEKL